MDGYFDANATTPPDPIAVEAWREAEREYWQNPSSPYRLAARAHHMLEDARKRLARILDCDPRCIVFTSGATEANNAVVRHYANRRQGVIALSAIEHPSVREPARAYFGDNCLTLPANDCGVVPTQTLDRLRPGQPCALVSVMAANNETGVLQPWQAWLDACRARKIPLHVDAAQWFGRNPATGLGQVDLVTGCAHKFGGPRGVGFLKLPSANTDFRIQLGGAQEAGHRGGTENYPAIAAMLAVLEKRSTAVEARGKAWALARHKFENRLLQSIPGIHIIGRKVPRLANTSALLMPQHPNSRWVARLDKKGFAVSTGSACATGKEGPSHVLAAMGISQDEARRMVRVSADWDTPAEAWTALATAFEACRDELDSDSHRPATTVIQLPA